MQCKDSIWKDKINFGTVTQGPAQKTESIPCSQKSYKAMG